MVTATTVVVLITALASVLGPHLAGLRSLFPVFGAVLTLFSHRTHGPAGATAVLDGLLLGLLAPAVLFLVLALLLPGIGFAAFPAAASAAVTTQGATRFAIPAATSRG
jgi:uncharacterized membrane protein (GlpM family)